jgi:hypothetical protein
MVSNGLTFFHASGMVFRCVSPEHRFLKHVAERHDLLFSGKHSR